MNKSNQLTLFPPGCLVNRSPVPGSEQARKITDTSGLKLLRFCETFGQPGLFLKMFQTIFPWHSPRRLLTWKMKAIPRNHILFQLVPSVPPTDGTDYMLLPTPTANAWKSSYYKDTALLRNYMTKHTSNYLHIALLKGFSPREIVELGEVMMGYPTGWTELQE